MLKFEINWNRKLALRGEGTASAVSDMLANFIRSNFVNYSILHQKGNIPSLSDLLSIPTGTENAISGSYDDGTGRAMWAVWRED